MTLQELQKQKQWRRTRSSWSTDSELSRRIIIVKHSFKSKKMPSGGSRPSASWESGGTFIWARQKSRSKESNFHCFALDDVKGKGQ